MSGEERDTRIQGGGDRQIPNRLEGRGERRGTPLIQGGGDRQIPNRLEG